MYSAPRMPDPLAHAAVAPVRAGMLVGLGTGRAASRAIHALAARAEAERLSLTCVSTSEASAALARSLGLTVLDFARVDRVDYLFDGADEVDGRLRMLKGRGGAMTREKVVARAAARRVYLIDDSKRVGRLGERFPLPIEVIPFALASVERACRELGLEPDLRLTDTGAPYETDNACRVLDAPIPAGADPERLGDALDATPGVLDHGLFLIEADEILVEDGAGAVTRLTR